MIKLYIANLRTDMDSFVAKESWTSFARPCKRYDKKKILEKNKRTKKL